MNDLESLAGVENMSKLIQLHFRDNEVASIEPVAGLQALTRIEMAENQISDLTPLEGLGELRRIQAATNSIDDLGPLAGLDKLANIDLRYNPDLVDLSVLGQLPQLGWLGVGGGDEGPELGGLMGAPVITTLLVVAAAPPDFDVVPTLSTLSRLEVTQTSLSDQDLETIAQGPNIRTLVIDECGLDDLAPLASAPSLVTFSGPRNELESIAPIAAWSDVETVVFEENPLKSLEGIEALEELAELDVSQTEIDDLAPLLANQWFRLRDQVDLRETDIDEGDCPAVLELIEREAIVRLDDGFECE